MIYLLCLFVILLILNQYLANTSYQVLSCETKKKRALILEKETYGKILSFYPDVPVLDSSKKTKIKLKTEDGDTFWIENYLLEFFRKNEEVRIMEKITISQRKGIFTTQKTIKKEVVSINNQIL